MYVRQRVDCATWVYDGPSKGGKSNCRIAGTCSAISGGKTGKAVGTRAAGPPKPPAPPLPFPPLPPKVAPGSQKNLIMLLTDDQDLRLGSMRAMPYTLEYIGAAGVNMSNFFVNTPICCPSRTTLLSGRWNHNNKVLAQTDKGCMGMNTSRDHNPEFWTDSIVSKLHRDHGYATGMFGKVLNVMDTFGCVDGYNTPNLDRTFVM